MPSSDFYRRAYGAMADGQLPQRFTSNQKGNGFFGRIIKGSIMPLIKSVLPYLKEVALDGVGGLVSELKEGKTVREASKNQLKRTSSTVLGDMAKRVKGQTGSGVRGRRRRRRRAPQKGSGFRKRLRRQGQSKRRKSSNNRGRSRHSGPFKV